ncbi:integrase catalytic domain-containing protein [Nephila pilipes]|uniref:Integrase catalytic domain-containing protein n=1 Tax=Nephila pilipes TaxID=299642 RepID=A0A8X6MXD1_NEPPI|nr:integrase catalytic domain-containing protein [Nephila pilipes]
MMRVLLRNSTQPSAEKESTVDYGNKLKNLLCFLKCEVEGEERLQLARNRMNIEFNNSNLKSKKKQNLDDAVPSASSLFSGDMTKRQLRCVFCDKAHDSKDCFLAQNWYLEKKKEAISIKKMCYVCFKGNHKEKTANQKSSVLDQLSICGTIPRIKKGLWNKELREKKIWIADYGEGTPEIELLIGADFSGQLFTELIHKLECGLIAYETYLGWITISRSSNYISSTSQSSATESIIMLTHSEKIEHFWDLELLGIKKPTEKTSREEVAKFFNNTLSTDLDGLYMMKLTWTDNSSLPDNKKLAEKRLLATTSKLISSGRYSDIKIQFSEVGKMRKSLKRRLVFGLSYSPFLLGAVINNLLENCPQEYRAVAEILKKCFCVDICVTSVDTEEELSEFVQIATDLMKLGSFELRGWENTSKDADSVPSSVLGLLWDRKDLLFCDTSHTDTECEPMSRRNVLSCIQKVFDPIGFTSPVTIVPKLLLQETWRKKLGWDEGLSEQAEKKFR